MFMFPITLYVSWLKNGYPVFKKKYFAYFISVYMLLCYLLLPISMGENIILYISFLSCMIFLLYKIPASLLFLFTFFLMLQTPFLLFSHQVSIANRIAVSVYFYMIIGVILGWIQLRQHRVEIWQNRIITVRYGRLLHKKTWNFSINIPWDVRTRYLTKSTGIKHEKLFFHWLRIILL